MLTLEDIILIYNAEFDIEIDDKEEEYSDDDPYILGHCAFDLKIVFLYLDFIGDSIHDLYKSAIHEFIHVRDYLRGTITDESIGCKDEETMMKFIEYERRVEQETELTYMANPDIGKIIFESWGLTQYTNRAA
jgi:hypothetical protein